MAVVILNLYHRAPNKPVPQKLKRAVFGPMTTMLCMRGELDDVETTRKVSPNDKDDSSLAFALARGIRMEEFDASNPKAGFPQTADPLPDDVMVYIRWQISRAKDQEIEDKIKSEWIALGKVFDRFMLYIFLLLTIIEIGTFTGLILGW